MDDRELLDEFVKARSQGAFRELVERHLPVVYSTARRLVQDAHLAEEVAQSVFTTLAQKADSIRPPQVLGGWLYNTTRHLAMHAVRTEQRRREREQTAFAMQSLNQTLDDAGLTEHLEPALAELDVEDRDALVLRFLANRGLREVGAELGVSEDAARKRVSRALERLRILLEQRGVTATGVLLAATLTASTLAVPAGLGATIATTALAPITVATVAKVSLFTAKSLSVKVAVAAIVVASVGGGALLVQQWQSASSGSAMAAASPAPTPTPANNTTPGTVAGILRSPDGRPLAGAEVFLSTASDKVPVYSEPSGKVVSTVTAVDGRFSFPSDPANRAVIVLSEAGYGQATVAELVAQPDLTLQPWARVEGVLREGTVPQANQTIHLSRTRFGSKSQEQAYRTVHDRTTKTDASGHYAFPRVAPGDAWISWRKNGYDVQYRYFDLQPGQSLVADIGGRGQAVTGRAVLMDSDETVKFYGSVWPMTPHQMRRPLSWSQLSSEEQDALTAEWEQTPDAKSYNQERCPIDFRLDADGNFTVPDLPTGEYRVVVATWTGAPVRSRMVGRGNGKVIVPVLPGGRSDAVLDMGEVKVYYTAPLAPGDRAPLFETVTLDGKPVKLADFSGKHVLLNFWNSDAPEAVEEMAVLKEAQSKWSSDKRFVLLGINMGSDVAAVRKFATEHELSWMQCAIGKEIDLPMRYRLRRLASVLIGPDGLIVQSDLRGPAITDALQEALGAK